MVGAGIFNPFQTVEKPIFSFLMLKQKCLSQSICLIQGWKFSDFSLISDFFTLTIMKMEISSKENVSNDITIDSDYQKKNFISDFFIEPDLHPCL